MSLATLELDAAELQTLLALLQARHGELERMVQNLEEGEGMDLPRHNALKTMRPQLEFLEVLQMKVEGALREVSRNR